MADASHPDVRAPEHAALPVPGHRAVMWSRKHLLTVMFLLVFALTWVVWIPRAAGVPMGVVGQAWTWAPAVAACLTAAFSEGRVGLGNLLTRLLRWRVRWHWYAVVVVGPASFSLAVAGVYTLLGGSWSSAAPRALQSPLMLPLLLLILSATDGLGEEIAWRGYALPRLLARYATLTASVILGVFWALWHLPLLWTAGLAEQQPPLWLLLLDLPAKSILFTWVFLRTRGSVLIAALFHGSTNLFSVSPAGAVTGDLMLPVLATAAKWLLVLVVIATSRFCLGQRPSIDASVRGRHPSRRPQR